MTTLISVDDALTALSKHRLQLSTESVPLNKALGRRLAAPLTSKLSRPPVAVSAMDGYAVRLADVRTPNTQLNVIGEIPAGHVFQDKIGPGQAARIFTGSELPNGADHIVIQEDTDRIGGVVTVKEKYKQSEFVRAAGIDFQSGTLLIETGKTIGPAELAIAAAANSATLDVFNRPKVGVLANGDELKPPGSKLGEGQIVNSNPPALAALVEQWGGQCIDLGIAKDSKQSIREHIQNAADIDLFLPVGGASVGDHDHMRSAFREEGFAPVFEKIAIKPGKPTWFSTKGSKNVLGLPGNPASALVCAHIFASTLLGVDIDASQINAKLCEPLNANGKREEFLRAFVSPCKNGTLEVLPHKNQDSSLLRPFLTCNALIRREIGASAKKAGDLVPILLIGKLKA